jgi:hypothetical protein
MCGEIDEHDHADEALFDRFLELASRYGVSPDAGTRNAPTELNGEAVRSAYMDRLFKDGLRRALSDGVKLPEGERMDALAGQAIVFARLAGFLAGMFPPEADQFRTIVAALTQGHSEPAEIV